MPKDAYLKKYTNCIKAIQSNYEKMNTQIKNETNFLIEIGVNFGSGHKENTENISIWNWFHLVTVRICFEYINKLDPHMCVRLCAGANASAYEMNIVFFFAPRFMLFLLPIITKAVVGYFVFDTLYPLPLQFRLPMIFPNN